MPGPGLPRGYTHIGAVVPPEVTDFSHVMTRPRFRLIINGESEGAHIGGVAATNRTRTMAHCKAHPGPCLLDGRTPPPCRLNVISEWGREMHTALAYHRNFCSYIKWGRGTRPERVI